MLIPVPGRRFYTGELRVLPIFQQFTPGGRRGTDPLAAQPGAGGPDSDKKRSCEEKVSRACRESKVRGINALIQGLERRAGRAYTLIVLNNKIRRISPMGQDARTESLQAKHKEIEFIIFEEEKRPLPDYAAVQELKRKKLKIKDELIRMTGR